MRAAVLAAAAVTALITGCELSEPPDLVAVDGVTPRLVSAGDRLEVSGRGFPEGRPATLILRGDVYRAGAAPVHDVRLKMKGASHSQSLVTAEIDEAVERRFCDTSDATEHATFRGDIRIAFESRGSAPPVVGTLRGTSLDIVPSDLTAEDLRAKEQQGARLLAYLGFAVAPTGGPDGMVLQTVTPDSPGDAAGLRAGDVVLSFDDVAVRSPGDLRPNHGRRTASLEVRRGGAISLVDIDISRINPRAPADLASAAVLVGVASLLSLLWMSPLPLVLAWLERRLHMRTEKRRSALPAFGRRWVHREVSVRAAGSVARAAVCVGLFAPLCRGKFWLSEDRDVATIYVVSSVCLVVLRLVAGGLRKGGGWSFVSGMGAAFRSIAFALPGALAIVSTGIVVGSLSPADIVDAQGVLPWQWNGLKNPGLFVAMFLFSAALLPRNAAFEPWPELEDAPGQLRVSSLLERLHDNTERLHAVIAAGLITLLFLGGWAAPHGFDELGASRIAAALGPLVFFVKAALLSACLGGVRSLIGRLPLEAPAVFAYKWLLPLSVVASAIAVFWAEAAARLEADTIAGAALVGLVLAATGLVACRLRTRGTANTPQTSVNPWL